MPNDIGIKFVLTGNWPKWVQSDFNFHYPITSTLYVYFLNSIDAILSLFGHQLKNEIAFLVCGNIVSI